MYIYIHIYIYIYTYIHTYIYIYILYVITCLPSYCHSGFVATQRYSHVRLHIVAGTNEPNSAQQAKEGA